MIVSKERKLSAGEKQDSYISVNGADDSVSAMDGVESFKEERRGGGRTLSGKRKEHPPLPTHPTGRFKAVSHLMVALQRFKGALNPTYTYGKRTPSHSSEGKMVVEVAETPEVTSETTAPSPGSRQLSPAPGKVPVYQHRGHRTHLLFAPIPDMSTPVQTTGRG
eukprot:jgi/Botrbrau1/999/Bobra.114_1s0037.1